MTTPIIADLNKERYCIIRLPSSALPYLRFKVDNNLSIVFASKTKSGEFYSIERIPPGKWIIIGLGKDLTNDQWKEIIEEEIYPLVKGYKDYIDENELFTFPYQSGHSWLKSLNADQNYLILKQQP